MPDSDGSLDQRANRREALLWDATSDYLESLAPELADAGYRAAVVHWFNADVLAALLGSGPPPERLGTVQPAPNRSQRLYHELQQAPFVEEYPKHGHAVHSLTRRVMLDRLWREEPGFYRAVSTNAARYHGRDFEQDAGADWDDVIEYAYHLLVIDEEKGIDLVATLLDGISETGSASLAHALVTAAEEHLQAGRLSRVGGSTVRLWRASVTAQSERYDEALAAARELLTLDDESAPATLKWVAARLAGSSLLATNRYPQAYDAYLEARRYEQPDSPDDAVLDLYDLGRTCHLWNHYDDAHRFYAEALQTYVDADRPTPVGVDNPEAWLADDGSYYVAGREAGDDQEDPSISAESFSLRPVPLSKLLGSIWLGLAWLHENRDDYAQAEACARLAGQIASQVDDHQVAIDAAALLYRLSQSIGDAEVVHLTIEHQEQLARIAEERGDLRGKANALLSLGAAYLDLLEYDAAEQRYDEVLATALQLDDALLQAQSRQDLARLAWFRGQGDLAASHWDLARELLHEKGYREEEARVFVRLAEFEKSRHEPEQARAHYSTALELFRELGNELGQFEALQGLGDIAETRLDFRTAVTRYREAIEVARRLHVPTLEAEGLSLLASVQSRLQDHDAAKENHKRALALTRAVGSRAKEAKLLQDVAYGAVRQRSFGEAVRLYRESQGMYAALRDPRGEVNALLGLSSAYQAWQRFPEGIEAAEEARTVAARIGDPDYDVLTLRMAALAHSYAGDPETAVALMESALSLNPTDPETWGGLSWVLNEAGQYERALRYSERALNRDAALTWVLCNRGLALLATGNPAEALDAYHEAIRVSPPDEDFAEDVAALRRFLEQRPDVDGGQEAFELLAAEARRRRGQEPTPGAHSGSH